MGKDSKISWTHSTFNPWQGCVKVSAGCQHCYAESNQKRWGFGWGPDEPRRFMSDNYWKGPVKWNKEAAAEGIRRRVFCASFSDVFERLPDTKAEWQTQNLKMDQARARLWKLIEDTPWLDWLLLTKRPENMRKLVPIFWNEQGWPANVWAGTSCEDQATAAKRIPILVDVPAKVRWLSCEPLIGPMWLVDQKETTLMAGGFIAGKVFTGSALIEGIHWVIVGGESGAEHRPMDIAWVRSLYLQCKAAGVAFFLKQLGGPMFDKKHDLADFPPDLRVQDFPEGGKL